MEQCGAINVNCARLFVKVCVCETGSVAQESAGTL